MSDVEIGSEVGDQGRDLLADIIDAYMAEGGEFRSYDLVDRIHRRLNQAAWYLLPGENIKGLISEADALTVQVEKLHRERDELHIKLMTTLEAWETVMGKLDAAERQNEVLRAALAPFVTALEASEWTHGNTDDAIVDHANFAPTGARYHITIGHLRSARAALKTSSDLLSSTGEEQ